MKLVSEGLITSRKKFKKSPLPGGSGVSHVDPETKRSAELVSVLVLGRT